MSKVVRLNEKDIERLVRKIMTEEKKSKTVDMKGKKCTNCKKGKYGETSQLDDLEGVLHCTNCGEKTDRYVDKTVKESWPKRELERKVINFRRDI